MPVIRTSRMQRCLKFFCILFIGLWVFTEECAVQESSALLDFKASVNDPSGSLSSWVNTTDCCSWRGIQCHPKRRHVNLLDLHGLGLSTSGGRIDSSLFVLKHLTYLDLSENAFYGIPLPSDLGSLTELMYLNMSRAGFEGAVPSELGNLSSLRALDLSNCGYSLRTPRLMWLSNLSSLEYLSLYYTDLSVATDISWGDAVGSLSALTYLQLSLCSLSGSIPPPLLNLSSLAFLDLSDNYLSEIPSGAGYMSSLVSLDLTANFLEGPIPHNIGNLSNLQYLDLSFNRLSGKIPSSVGGQPNSRSPLSYLNLRGNALEGPIPANIGSVIKLTYLDLAYNQLNGAIPPSIGNLSSLSELYLYHNQLQGSIPPSVGRLSAISRLDFSFNQLSGSLPWTFGNLSSLRHLDLSNNQLNESVPSCLTLPSSLTYVNLSSNHMATTITGTLLQNVTELSILDLSHSGSSLDIAPSWIPPFQLTKVYLKSCNITGPIPIWFSTQTDIEWLDLSDNNLVGDIPSWLPITAEQILFLNDNNLEGQIPSWLCARVLDISNNGMTGNIPVSLADCPLRVLNVANNHLEGNIPNGFGKGLESLHVHGNNLHGSLPPSLANCTDLMVLDLADNHLTGNIPTWIGNLTSLQVLVMKSNYFGGKIPPTIGQLPQLRVLDLSGNCVSGVIPRSIFFLSAMTLRPEQTEAVVLQTGGQYQESFDLIIKHQERHYGTILSTLLSIDLSNNLLTGDVSDEIGNLKGLMFLNLSMNQLTGPIPGSIGGLTELESLDLSTNNLSGEIPQQFESLSFLGVLDLSNNNLSGKIPRGGQMLTFDESSFLGNPELCGDPLKRNCSLSGSPTNSSNTDSDDGRKDSEKLWWYVGVGLSFGVGFACVISWLALNMPLSRKYLELVDAIILFLFPWLTNARR